MPKEVGDENEGNPPDVDDADAPIEIPSENDDGGVHDQPPSYEASLVPLRRSDRIRQPSIRYPRDQFVLLTDGGEPESFEEAINDESKQKWIEAMQEEIKSLHENKTFEP